MCANSLKTPIQFAGGSSVFGYSGWQGRRFLSASCRGVPRLAAAPPYLHQQAAAATPSVKIGAVHVCRRLQCSVGFVTLRTRFSVASHVSTVSAMRDTSKGISYVAMHTKQTTYPDLQGRCWSGELCFRTRLPFVWSSHSERPCLGCAQQPGCIRQPVQRTKTKSSWVRNTPMHTG